MGVEHALVCKKCKTWIDLHKCYMTAMLCGREFPYHPHTTDKIEIESYWGQRALWFLWKHREHGGEVEWANDAGDWYYEVMQPSFKEEASHDEAWNDPKYKKEQS